MPRALCRVMRSTLSGMRMSCTPGRHGSIRHRAVLRAQAALLAVDVARPPAGDDLVGLPRRAIEVEDELERRRQPAVPVTRQARSLIPGVPPEPPPALGAHPFDPACQYGCHSPSRWIMPRFTITWPSAAMTSDKRAKHAAHQHVPIGRCRRWCSSAGCHKAGLVNSSAARSLPINRATAAASRSPHTADDARPATKGRPAASPPRRRLRIGIRGIVASFVVSHVGSRRILRAGDIRSAISASLNPVSANRTPSR